MFLQPPKIRCRRKRAGMNMIHAYAAIILMLPFTLPIHAEGRRANISMYCPARPLPCGRATLQSIESIQTARPLYGKPDTMSVLIIGDIMLHSKQMAYPYSSFLEGITDRMQKADLTIANMEFTLAGKPYTGYPAFSAPDEYAEYVADCGTDVFLTANNHILDRGTDGIERTMQVYREMERAGKIRFTGTSGDEEEDRMRYPLIITIKGIRIALVNFTYGTNVAGRPEAWPKVNRTVKDDILAALDRAERRHADFIIALPHWGNEYRLAHSGRQEAVAKWLAGEGADAVVGTHPHVVQDSCSMGRCPVFYSIGNTVSNMSAENTQMGLAVELGFVRDANGDLSMLKPSVTYLWCSLPGELTDNYKVISVKDYIGKRELWKNPSGYDRMLRTYIRVKDETRVNDEHIIQDKRADEENHYAGNCRPD